jgi:DNA-binding transcriptional LysR family regulator
MKIDLLKTFIAVVKHNSITRASEEVFLTQPAVTKQLRILEQEYGVKLFEKERNKLFLTDDGKVLLDYAHRILGLYNESHAVLNEQRGQVKGTLRFGVNLTLGIYVLPRFIKLFGDIYPDLKFEMFMDNTDHVIKVIKRGDVNFGFIGVVPTEFSLAIHPFYRDRLKVVIGPKLGLKRRTTSWKELEKIPFIGREKGSDIRETYEEWFSDRPVKLTPRMELNNTEAIKLSIQCGLGFSILPWCTIEQEVRWGLLQTLSLPHFDPIQQFYVSHYKGKKFSKPERMFLEYVFKFIEKGELTLPPI